MIVKLLNEISNKILNMKDSLKMKYIDNILIFIENKTVYKIKIQYKSFTS